MSEAPAEKYLAHNGGLPTGNYPKADLVRYIRADLHEAAVAAARAEGMRAVFSHIKEAAEFMRKFGLGDHAAAIEAALVDASDEFPEASK